ncbi:MAG: hypothetical protein O2U61_02315 [Candidatus Bathyarchaeota archaeon]|nr:hypothetical protein [Candidatus Bathyarchaeota archaeon]
MPGGGTLIGAAVGVGAIAPGLTTLTEGTGFTVGAAVGAANDVPQLEQKVASSLFVAPH